MKIANEEEDEKEVVLSKRAPRTTTPCMALSGSGRPSSDPRSLTGKDVSWCDCSRADAVREACLPDWTV